MWYQPNYMDIQKLFAMKVSTLFDVSAFNHSSTPKTKVAGYVLKFVPRLIDNSC